MPESTKKRKSKGSKVTAAKGGKKARQEQLDESLELESSESVTNEQQNAPSQAKGASHVHDDEACTCSCGCHHHESQPFDEDLSDEDIEDLSLFFKALADPSRLKIVVALLRHGELSVSEIAKECESTVSATSHQLALLRMHKLVSVKRQGLKNIYRLCDFHISEGIKLAIEHIKE